MRLKECKAVLGLVRPGPETSLLDVTAFVREFPPCHVTTYSTSTTSWNDFLAVHFSWKTFGHPLVANLPAIPFGSNLPRLAHLKRKCEPQNVLVYALSQKR